MSTDPPAPAEAEEVWEEYDRTATKYGHHRAGPAARNLVEQAIIARYLAACAAPGCGHEQAEHYVAEDPHAEVCLSCSTPLEAEHAYVPRSELLARPLDLVWLLRDEAAELEQLAESAKARAQVYREALDELEAALSAERGVFFDGVSVVYSSRLFHAKLRAKAALSPVVEGD